MIEGPDNIVLQDLRRFDDEREARFEDGMQDLKAHLRSVEGQVTALRADTTHGPASHRPHGRAPAAH